MANFNRVKFNDLHFSRDGDAGSVKCMLSVSNLLPFRLAKTRNVFTGLDGTPSVQLGFHTGSQLSIKIDTVKSEWLDDLIDLLNETDSDQETITVVIEGETGNFEFECLLVNFTSPGEFQIGYVADIQIDLSVAEVISATSPN